MGLTAEGALSNGTSYHCRAITRLRGSGSGLRMLSVFYFFATL